MIVYFLIPALVAMVFALLRRFAPSPLRSRGNVRFDESSLRRRYNWIYFATLVCSWAIATPVTASLSWLDMMIVPRNRPGEYLWSPTAWIWWAMPAFLVGLILAGKIVEHAVRTYDRELADALEDHVSQRYGVNMTRLEQPFALLIIAASAVFVGLALGWSVRFGRDRIIEDPLLPGRSLVHRYDEVRRISLHHFHSRRYGDRLELVIRFSDGHSLQSKTAPQEASDDEIRAIARVVSDRARVGIDSNE